MRFKTLLVFKKDMRSINENEETVKEEGENPFITISSLFPKQEVIYEDEEVIIL